MPCPLSSLCNRQVLAKTVHSLLIQRIQECLLLGPANDALVAKIAALFATYSHCHKRALLSTPL